MTIASDLLQRHIQTLVDDNAQWQALIADDVLWELAYAPSIGHPAQLSGREEAARHAIWFVGAVEKFRFFELNPSGNPKNSWTASCTDPIKLRFTAVLSYGGEGRIPLVGSPLLRTQESQV